MQLQIKKVTDIEAEVSDEKLCWKETKLEGKASGVVLEG